MTAPKYMQAVSIYKFIIRRIIRQLKDQKDNQKLNILLTSLKMMIMKPSENRLKPL
jgi:hypothetical protein